MRKKREQYVATLQGQVDQVYALLAEHGIDSGSLRKVGGMSGVLKKVVNKQYSAALEGIMGLEAQDAQAWLKKDDPLTPQFDLCWQNGLGALLGAMQEALHGRADYYTAKLLLEHLYQLGLVEHYQQEITAYRGKEKLFFLADMADVLTKVVDYDTPLYVYERIGSRLRHYLLDEAQDISLSQWKVLSPLLHEGLSQGYGQLMVGDSKQSIYRWRGANAQELFARVREGRLGGYVEKPSLKTNWRSLQQVVIFNNDFFQAVKQKAMHVWGKEVLDELWEGVTQEPQLENGGQVAILERNQGQAGSAPKEDLGWMLEKIAELLEAGYDPASICVLARKNQELAVVAQAITAYNPAWRVYSQDALLLSTSVAVQLLVAALQYFCYKQDVFAEQFAHLAEQLGVDSAYNREWIETEKEHRELSLYELVEDFVQRLGLDRCAGQQAYLHAFLSQVFAYQMKEGSYLAGFVALYEEKRSTWAITGQKQGGIELLTIHKAKGMEFDVVFVPFVDWKLDHLIAPRWWSTRATPFADRLSCAQLTHKKELSETHFAVQYAEERCLACVDNLNILYVAFTRAKRALYASYMPKKPSSKATMQQSTYTMGYLIEDLEIGSLGLEERASAHGTWYETGALPAAADGKKVEKGGDLVYDRLPGRRNYPFVVLPNVDAELGTYVHGVLASVRTYAAFGEQHRAIMQKSALKPIVTQAYTMLAAAFERLAELRAWYGGAYRLYSECEVLYKGGSNRIDLLAVQDDEVHVVDFKTGVPVDTQAHQQQVARYVGWAKKLFPTKEAKGFLVYLSSGTIQAV